MKTPPPLFPIIVGVAGHRDLAPGVDDALRSAVLGVLIGLRDEFGPALHVLTALTDGADQLVADVAETVFVAKDQPLPIIAVAPTSMAAYRAGLSDKARFDHHWKRAVLRLELPDPALAPTDVHDDLRREQLAVLISRRSHILLSLWDGLPQSASPKVRRGGAAAIVSVRQEGEDTVPAFRRSRLFPDGVSQLDLSGGGPIVQIVTPRAKTGGRVSPDGAKPGECFLHPDLAEAADVGVAPASLPTLRTTPRHLLERLSAAARRDLGEIKSLNDRIADYGGYDAQLFKTQLGYVTDDGFVDPLGVPADHLPTLRRWQAAADTAAQTYQRLLMGELAPARSWAEMIKKGRTVFAEAGRPPHLGAVFWFAALVPIAVLLFEAFAHLGNCPLWLALYLAAFIGGTAYYRLRLEKDRLQNRFQDYRALAEAMRVQLFWGAAALPDAACDSYLRKQSGEMGWIQLALRGPALWAAAVALALDTPQRVLVTEGWIQDQIKFFGLPRDEDGKVEPAFDRKAVLLGDAAHRAKRLSGWILFIGLALSALLLVTALLKPYGVTVPELTPKGWPPMEALLVTAAATLPAIAAAFTLWVEFRAYEAQADSYGLMGRIFLRALRLAKAADDDKAFQAVARDLGREALAENAEWLADHRRRKIEQKT